MRHWSLPFVWILAFPFFTYAWQQAMVHEIYASGACTWQFPPGASDDGLFFRPGHWECPTSDMLRTLLPGLLNVGALLWLVVPGRTRAAAAWAGSLGVARFVSPLLMYSTAGATVDVSFELIGPAVFGADATSVSFALWMASVATLIAFRTSPSRHRDRLVGAGLLCLIGGVVIIAGVQGLLLPADAHGPLLNHSRGSTEFNVIVGLILITIAAWLSLGTSVPPMRRRRS